MTMLRVVSMDKQFYIQEANKQHLFFITKEYTITCGPYHSYDMMPYSEALKFMKLGQIYWENSEYEKRS